MLNVENINLFYVAAQALRGVSLKAEPGKVMCVLGRNGVGKTSLLRAMVGQYPIASGSIMFEIDFARDLKFYPFLAFRYSEITDTEAEYVRTLNNPELPDFSMQYTGITVGITARFKVWPFDPVDDEPSIFDQ